MYHAHFRGTHYEAGFRWGSLLLKHKNIILENIPFEITQERIDYALSCLPIYEKYYHEIDNWFAEERYQTLYSAFSEKNGGFNFPFAEKLLSGDYGFLCQYDRSTGKDTVWSVIYDMKRHKIYRSEGNPRRHKFKEDIRFQF